MLRILGPVWVELQRRCCPVIADTAELNAKGQQGSFGGL